MAPSPRRGVRRTAHAVTVCVFFRDRNAGGRPQRLRRTARDGSGPGAVHPHHRGHVDHVA